MDSGRRIRRRCSGERIVLRIDGDSSDGIFVCLVLLLRCRRSIHYVYPFKRVRYVFSGIWRSLELHHFKLISNKKMKIRDTSILPGDVRLLYVMLGYRDLVQCADGPFVTSPKASSDSVLSSVERLP